MRLIRATVVLTNLVVCSACTPQMFGAMISHKPGDTIDVSGKSPTYISFVYTHSYPEEFPIVMERAAYWCKEYKSETFLFKTSESM